jgi:hypothetical protein
VGVTSAHYSHEKSIGARFYRSKSGTRLDPKVSGKSAAGFDVLGKADAGVRITAETSHACVLHMLGATEKSITNREQVMNEVLALIGQGKWSIDYQIVMSRVRARRGFAAISMGAGQSLELKAAGHLQAIIAALDLGGAEFVLASSHATTDFLLYKFSERETPTFGLPVRVRANLWDRLLPWRTVGEFLIGPDGRRYPPPMLPGRDLSAFAPEDRCYDPARSAMSPAELAAMTVADVFEEVTSLPDEITLGYPAADSVSPPVPVTLAEVRRFRLPLPVVPAALAAADDSDEAAVRLDASSSSGRAQFIVYDRGGGEYRLEVTPAASVLLPAVVFLRYRTTSGDDRELIIPVDDDGRGHPSSAVNLEGYSARVPLWPSDPVPLSSVASWPEEIVQRSVRAAATVATADAWERLATAIPAAASTVINRELRALRNQP